MPSPTSSTKILVLNCGGTIACDRVDGKLTPRLTFAQIYPNDLAYDEIFPLGKYGKDSSTMRLGDIVKIAKAIHTHKKNYDQFLILHGTDTLSYTSAFLYHMLTFDATIVITGAMIAPILPNSDATPNITLALRALGTHNHGIYVAFGGAIIKGDDAIKINTTSPNAITGFRATNTIEAFKAMSIKVVEHRILTRLSSRVQILHLAPTTGAKQIDSMMLHGDVDGLIVLVFGMGGAQKEVFERLHYWARRGKRIIIKTQTPFGETNLDIYASSAIKPHKNITLTNDTIESAFAKLSITLANNHKGDG